MLSLLSLLLAFFPLDGPTPEVSRLGNGLQIVVVPDSREALVSVQVWFRAGSADDGDRYPGLCEVTRRCLEHGPEVPESLRVGDVRFESRTLRDACYFVWFGPRALLEDALRVEAQRLKNPLPALPLGGGGTVTASPSDEPTRRLLAAAFAGHPYQSPPGLVGDSASTVATAEVEEFLRRWFVPGNATLLVVGDVQPPAVLDAVRRYFAEVPWAEPPRRASWPVPSAERVRLPAVAGARAGLEVAWVTPGAADGENAGLAVLMERLCNAVDGPLYRRLTAAGCLPPRWRQEAGRWAGLTILSVDVEREAADKLEALIQEELERAARDVPTEIELNRARALAARAVRLEQASFTGRALRLGFYEVVAGDALLAGWELARAMQVTVGDLQRAAADLAGARTVYQPRTARAGESAAVAVALHAMDPRPAGTRRTIRDNVCVTVCAQPAAPLVEVRTLASGPTVTEALAVLTAVSSARHTAEQVYDYLTYHGLELFALVEGTRPALVARGPATHIAQMIELQAELLQHALRTLPTMRTIDIVVTGDVDERAAGEAARAAWSDWRQAAPSR